MIIHYPKLRNKTHSLSLGVFIAFKGTNFYILSVNEKLPVSKFRCFGNMKYSSTATFTFMFWSTADWFREKNQFYEPWNYGARDARAVCAFRSF